MEKTNHRKNNSVVWKCVCDCNGENSIVFVAANDLTSGQVQSCGCLIHERKREDLTGKIFGRWEVISFVGKNKKRENLWHCRCGCDNHTERDIAAHKLTSGISKSCGCLQKEIASKTAKSKAKDLTGMIFGKLKVIRKALDDEKINKNSGTSWVCECSCENHTIVIATSRNLLRGNKLSCGCLGKSYGEYLIE